MRQLLLLRLRRQRGQVHRLEEPLQGGALVAVLAGAAAGPKVAKLATALTVAPAPAPAAAAASSSSSSSALAANVKPVIIHEWGLDELLKDRAGLHA